MVAVGREHVLAAAEAFAPGPVILKPNRGGKGLGVQLFQTTAALRAHGESEAWQPPLDGVSLLQEYVRSPEQAIVRAEFIGGALHYAVRVDTRAGFELCPADACAVGEAFCPTGEEPRPQFEILEGFSHPVLKQYQAFLAANDVEIAGIESITDAQGRVFTYDVNTNTNYNADAEARAGRTASSPRSGMGRVAEFLGTELAALERAPARARRTA